MRKDKINVHPLERLLSLVIGGLLIRGGIRRRSLWGTLEAAVGTNMMYRGASGHCLTYQKLGIDTAHTAPVEIMGAVTIQRPIDEVYAAIRDLDMLPSALSYVEDIKRESDGVRIWRLRKGVFRFDYKAQVVFDETQYSIVWRSIPGSALRAHGWSSLRRAPGSWGTEARIGLHYDASGPLLFLAKALRRLGQVQLEAELGRLKQLLETGEVATNHMRIAPDRAQQPGVLPQRVYSNREALA